MNLTIHKYPLSMKEKQWITMPKGSEILSVQAQSNSLMLWAIVDKDQVIANDRLIFIRGTGTEDFIDPDWSHHGTVQMGNYVWHVFEACL